MSLSVCIPQLLEEGKLTKEQAAQASALFTELQQDFRRQFGDQAADAMASDAALKALEAQASRKRFLAARTIATRQRIEMELRGYNGGGGSGSGGGGPDGPIDPRSGPALFDGDDRARYSNVEGRRKAIRARAHGLIDRILADHSANLLGQVRNKAQLDDIVRELFGQDSGNAPARELADGWRQAAEMLRQRFNAAGGDIGKLDNWGLPQSHDARLVRAAGKDAWLAEIRPRLNREAMIDQRTGKPFTEEALEIELDAVFETIRSEGMNKVTPGGNAGAASLANRRGDARFLVFKSADDWMDYAMRFGAGSPFDAMMGHIDAMARDIALMEVLGPNPTATVRWLKDTIEKSAALDQAPDSKAPDKAFAATRQIDRLYAEVTGTSMRPENRALAIGFSSLRALQTAAKLGGATLSAVSDTAFQVSTRKFNGLQARTLLRDYVKLFKPFALEDQKAAVRLGLIAEEWSNRTAAQQRFLGEELTGEVTRRLASGVLQVSGLQRWTQAGRWAFGMEFLNAMTQARALRFAELDPGFRRMLDRNGVSAGDWDKIRATPLERERGADWIKPANIEDQALGDRVLEMIARETEMAVPTPDLRTRAMINDVAPRGTWHGEIIKSAFLFKSFGITVLLQHGGRIMALAGAQRARYAAGLIIGTTLMGAMAIFLKDIASGRDPRSANDLPFVDDETGEFEWSPGFWGAALLQGGGFGIFGDFIKSAESRFGGGIQETLAGPLASDVQGIINVAKADPEKRGKTAIRELRGLIPGQNLWYARLAMDRMVADQLMEAADPDYYQSFRRAERWNEEQGTEFYWRPGEPISDARAPNLQNIVTERSN